MDENHRNRNVRRTFERLEKKYSSYDLGIPKSRALANENRAKDLESEKGYGDFNPNIIRAQILQKAAEEWIYANEPRKAALDYRKAAEIIKSEEMYGRTGAYSDVERKQFKKLGREGLAKYLEKKADRLEKVSKGEWKGLGLSGKVLASISFIGLLSSIFFFSSNFTANVIGNNSNSSSNLIGTILFLCGSICAFIYFKNK